ncbi:MAG: sensor histidine kinase [Saprospiraceae bacterium]|nr:sensor histidine kinase [Saprospiraceae bacterium]
MDRIRPIFRSFFLFAIACLIGIGKSSAQPEFEQHLDFPKIQKLLNEGIDENNLRKQALAWYHWAYYDEVHTGISDSAFQYFDRSAIRFLKAGDSSAYQRVRADLADRLADKKLFDQAFRMYLEALDYYERNNNLYLEANLLARLNRACLLKGDSTGAANFKRRFMKRNESLKDTLLEIIVVRDEIDKLRKRHDYRAARSVSFRVLQLANLKKNDELITWAQYSIADNARLDRDYNTAIEYFHKAEKSNPLEAMRRDIYLGLSETYTALDSLQLANYYAIRYAKLGDTLLDRGRFASLQQLALRYDTRGKSEAIKMLQEQNVEVLERTKFQRLALAALGVAFFAVILASFFIARDYRHRLHTDRVIAGQTAELNLQRIRELEDKLKIETMQSMLVGQESERRRIAQDLHDSVGGLLAAIKMQVEKLQSKNGQMNKAEDLSKITNLIDNTVAETRHIARNMQPSTLLEFGLPTALRDLTNHFRMDGMPSISFQGVGDFSNLDHNLALHCYRIVQELLQNSLKHAKAKEILVQITRTDHQIDLLVEDDGAGYEPGNVKKGMGTDGIAQRVQFLKGEINIQSAKGQGTSTLVTVPLG